ELYELVREHPRYQWIEMVKAGRMLSSPTVWEDLAKTLLTTNTTWNMTRQMCQRLAALGTPYPGGGHAFPAPETIAAMNADELYRQIKALKGFGDYAAGSMLKLLGHFDRLATDTACRAVYKDGINGGVAAANDKEIAAYYAPFGRWQGLIQWMDVMEDWLRTG
ncbi:MAG TPA: hypothetical protein VHO69_10370, partial [Phototrophicaceae bacterium]|nr:hypothetical protein [Phototrophicaceae bacterium]